MTCLEHLRFRLAAPWDAHDVAALHTDSWRRHYRGAYCDAFLDGDVITDRQAVWADRLHTPNRRQHTILAEDNDRLVGFAHSVLDDDPTWGALLDNLHVSHEHKRRGIGARLLAATVQAVIKRATNPRLYLWVLEQNADAQAFYQAHGGTCVGRRKVPPPGGIPNRLNGSPDALRYAWPDPHLLLGRLQHDDPMVARAGTRGLRGPHRAAICPPYPRPGRGG